MMAGHANKSALPYQTSFIDRHFYTG